MAYSDEQLVKLDHKDVMNLDAETRLHWFKLLQVKHRELVEITQDLAHILHPDNESRIVALIGMTGIGKTTLATRILNTMLQKHWGTLVGPADVPYIFIKAPANGEQSLSWRTLYQRILAAANEILIDHKRETACHGDTIRMLPARATLASLRESVESMLTHRNVRLIVIDEAVHLLRFEGYSAVMDTLKSIASIHYTKLLLLGSYDLYDLITDYGQVARRSEILHYKRYRIDNEATAEGKVPTDKDEFREAITKLQGKWPSSVIPNFAAISDELMEVSLGSIGLLKAILLSCLEKQFAARNEAWDPRYLPKAVKSIKLLNKIRQETENGEEMLKGAAFGESLFSNSALLSKIIAKMESGPDVG